MKKRSLSQLDEALYLENEETKMAYKDKYREDPRDIITLAAETLLQLAGESDKTDVLDAIFAKWDE